MTVTEKLSKAKAKLIIQQPFFASLAINMPMVENAELNPPTMATDGKTIWFHPGFVDAISVDEVVFVLCHEVMHKVFSHMFRRGQRNPKKWNIAGDYIINDVLVKDNVGTMPQGALYDANIVAAGDGTTDGVYNILPDQDGGDGQGPTDGQWDNVIDASGSDAEVSEQESINRVQIAQAAQAAKMCGKLGANLERFVTAALKPAVAWEDVMLRFVSTKAKIDRSYQRPKRRFLSQGLYLPSLSGERLGTVVFGFDCSGSINQNENDQYAAEIKHVKEACDPERIVIIYFHHEVSRVDIFERDDDVVIRPNGTGGTAFSPIFRKIDELGIDPECCVVLTDLECSDFGPAPAYPTLWVSTHADKAPWGEVVMMKNGL